MIYHNQQIHQDYTMKICLHKPIKYYTCDTYFTYMVLLLKYMKVLININKEPKSPKHASK